MSIKLGDKIKSNMSHIPPHRYQICLVIYSDNESMMALLKSMDRLAKEGGLFRCFCGPPDSSYTDFLSKLKWYDGTVEPYCYSKNVQDGQQQQQNQSQIQTQTIINISLKLFTGAGDVSS